MRKFGIVSVMTATALFGLSACSGGEEKKAPAAEAAAEVASTTAPAAGGAEALPTDGGVTPAPAAVAGATPAEVAAPASPAAAAAGGASVQLAGLTGDVARGQRVFMQCRTCHAVEVGVNKAGPSLHGIIGRKAGTIPNFRYSNANKNSGITWTEETMFAYLENPRAYMPGTYMSFVGLRQPQQRADVVAYLKTLG